MQTILALVTLLSLLGPEVPLGSPALGPAAGDQTLLSVASNGRDFVALWSGDGSSRVALHTGRIDATGHAVEPAGHLISDATLGGRLIWSGSQYLLLYQRDPGPFLLQALDDDGHPAGAPKEIDLGVAPRAFATNGRTLLTLQVSGQLWLNSLADGSSIWKVLLPVPTDTSEIAVLPNGDYRFVTLANKNVLLVTANETTGVVTTRTLAHADHMGAFVRPDGSTLVAWTEGALTKVELVDGTQPVTIASDGANASVAVGWDGHQFGIALGAPLRVVRVAADGRVLDTVALTGGPADSIHIATSATDVLIAGDVMNVDRDVVARLSHGFDDVAASQVNVIASSPAPQGRPRVADGRLVLWQERGVTMAQQPDGTPHEVISATPPLGIARGTSSYLVAWMMAGADPGTGTLFGRRLAFDGTPIDRDPIAIAQVNFSPFANTDGTPSIAFDGTNFLVVWGDPTTASVVALRIGQDGHAIDAQPIALPGSGQIAAAIVAPRVVWSGSVYVVAWDDQLISLSLISPRPAAPARVRVARVASSGQVLDAQPIAIWEKNGEIDSIGLAASGDGVELVWSLDCAYEIPLKSDGTPARADVHALDCNPALRVSGASVAWDGREFAAVWNVGDVVKVSGVTMLDEAVQVNPPGTSASQPSIAASATGATIAYVRLDGGVSRVFTRALVVRGVPPRRRTSG